MKRAIINMADTGAMESTLHMLTMIGYDCYRPSLPLLAELRRIGLSNVLSVEGMITDWGYARPRLDKLASVEDMEGCDLFIDTKAHTNYPLITKRWPHLENKILWCCLNGGDPRKRKDGLPWADPPCPVLTNNQWYHDVPRSYVFMPYYTRFNERYRDPIHTAPPICLVHNVQGWGYGKYIDQLQSMGVEFYGGGDGNECLLSHAEAMNHLSKSKCLIHVKVGDTVGYAMLEAMASECPFFCTQFYINECKLERILIPGETCITFDMEKLEDLKSLWSDTSNMQRVARNAKAILLEDMWNDADDFDIFMQRNFS